MMWQLMCCGLGDIYYQSLVVCIVLSAMWECGRRSIFSIRSLSCARPRMCTGGFRASISTAQDPALFVPRAQRASAGPSISAVRKPLSFLDLSSSLASGRPSSSSGSCSGNKTHPGGVLVSRGRHDPGSTHEKPCRKITRAGSDRSGGPVRHLRSEDLSARVPLSQEPRGRRGSRAGRAAEGVSEDRRVPRRRGAVILDLSHHVQRGDVASPRVQAESAERDGEDERRRRAASR